MSKIAEMLETASLVQHQGTTTPYGGVRLPGWITWEHNGVEIYLAFSGGTEEDLQVSRAGEKVMNEWLDLIGPVPKATASLL